MATSLALIKMEVPQDSNQSLSSPITTKPMLDSSTFTAVAFDGDIDKTLRPIFAALGNVAEALSTEQPFNYQIFKINRFIAWLSIDKVPASENKSLTQLPPPDEVYITYLNKLLAF